MQYPPGTFFGPYEVTGHLGTGGMGAVLRAVDTRLHREVAVKVLQSDNRMPGLRERFLREARAASSLNHPNICTVFDIGEEGDTPYMVMELLRGETLKETIHRSALSVERIIEISREITAALIAAHGKGIIHRDIKPANIFLVPTPHGGDQVKVLDFGLAKIESQRNSDHLTEGLTSIGATVGTVAYMSPEQARGEQLDARSDLFSLGVLMYEMATRTVPFHGATSALVFVELLSKNPQPVRDWNKTVPKDLEHVILRLLDKDRNYRYQSANDLFAALSALGGSSSSLRPASTPSRPSVIQPEDPNVRRRTISRVAGRTPSASQQMPRASGGPRVPSSARPSYLEDEDNNDPLPDSEAHRRRTASGVSSVHRVSTHRTAVHTEPKSTVNFGKLLTVLVVLIVLGIGGYVAYKKFGPASKTVDADGRALQITPIENKTGDATLDGIETVGLEVLLSESPELSVRGESSFLSAAGNGAIDAALARQTAQQNGATAYLIGNIASTGSQNYKLSVEVLRTSDNQRLAYEEEQLGSQQVLAEALNRITSRLRSDLGESDDSIAANSAPLEREASSVLPVLGMLRSAHVAWSVGNQTAAAKTLREAIQRDPKCAECWLDLATLQVDSFAEAGASTTLQSASSSVSNTSERQRDRYSFLVSLSSGDPVAAADLARKWATARSGDIEAYLSLAQALRAQGRFSEAETEAQNALRLDPASYRAIAESERSLLALNRFESITQAEERNTRIGIQRPGIAMVAAYALGRIASPEKETEHAALAEHSVRDQIRFAVYLDNTAQLRSGASTWSAAAAELASEPSLVTAATSIRLQAATNRALMGDCNGAAAFLRLAGNSELSAQASFQRGFTAVLCGDLATAREVVVDLNLRAERNLTIKTYYLANLNAAIALHDGQPDQALKLLSTARGPFQSTVTAYLRAQSHVSQKRTEVAIADLQSVLANRGVALQLNGVLYPVAQRLLGRTYALSGDKDNAEQAFATLATLWPKADPDISGR